MNILQQIYPGDAAASFLVRVLVEITLVMSVSLLIPRLIGRRNAAFRHGVLVCALLCVALAPLTTWGLERLGWKTFEISLEHEPTSAVSAAGPQRLSSQAEAQTQFWTVERARSSASLLLLVWLSGTVVLGYRLANGTRKVRRIRNSAVSVSHPKLDAALANLGQHDSLPRAPILFSRRLHSPVVVGPRQTTVILPEKLLEQLDEQQLRCVLAHEFTHVRQHDPLVGLIQRIVEAGYWPHPLVHLLNRDLIRAREEVCDNAALHGTTAPQYANTLLTVALGSPKVRSNPATVGLMTPRWRLEERVQGLLDPHRRLNTTMNLRHIALMAVLLVGGTTVIAGARIVAAPVPHVPQDTVDLYTHYDSHTHSVVITAKKSKKAPADARTIRVYTTKADAKSADRVEYYTIRDEAPKHAVRIIKDGSHSVTIVAPRIVQVKPVTTKVETYTVTADPTADSAAVLQLSKSKDGQSVTIRSDAKQGDPTATYTVTTSSADGASADTVKLSESTAVIDGKPQVVFGKAGQSSDVVIKEVHVGQGVKSDVGYVVRDEKSDPVVFDWSKTQSGAHFSTVAHDDVRLVTSVSTPTTVYVENGHIRVVGDSVRVVYIKAATHAKTFKTAKKPKN